VAFPPASPFTDQLTPSLVVPVTVALKGCVAPDRTLAAVGVMLIEIPGGGGDVFLVPVLPQPAWTRMNARKMSRIARRKMVSICCDANAGRMCPVIMRRSPAGEQLDGSTT
jgi:hypothetical protein